MRRELYLALLIVSIVLISGCSGLPFGVFGSDVLDVRTSVTQDSVKDVLELKDALIIPSPPLLPGQPVLLSFVLENKDDTRNARNVYVKLFNAPLFRSSEDRMLCNSAGCLPDRCSLDEDPPCKFLPGEEKQINFNLVAPSEAEIAGIKTDTTLDYSVSYDFTGAFLYSVPVVSEQEIAKLQRSRDKLTVSIQKAHSSGPVKIDADLQGASYILSSQPAVINFKVQNRGSGILNGSRIQENIASPFQSAFSRANLLTSLLNSFFPGPSLPELQVPEELIKGIVIKFPEDFVVTPPNNFACDPDNLCYNTAPIDLFRDESRVSMRFTVRLRDTAEFSSGAVPFRSYQILSLVGYTYELRNSVSATINPFQNVG